MTVGEPSAVGVVGLGAMGAAIARHLLDVGFEVIVFSLPPSAIDELTSEGARTAADPAELAVASRVIIASLPDVSAVRQVATGQHGLASGAAPGTVVIDTSTIAPSDARTLASELDNCGVAYLDAPVSGGPLAARNGTLSVMVGGHEADLERVRHVLDAIAAVVIHCGPSGAGQVCKACNQLVVMATLEVVAETLVLARASGLDPARVRAALLAGYAASRVLELHGQKMLERDFAPGGKARFNLKDIEIIGELSGAAGLALPAFDVAAERLTHLINAGGGDLDNAAIVTVVEDSMEIGRSR